MAERRRKEMIGKEGRKKEREKERGEEEADEKRCEKVDLQTHDEKEELQPLPGKHPASSLSKILLG